MTTKAEHFDIVAEVIDDEYVAVQEDTFAGMAINEFREFRPKDGEETTIYYIYVTDEAGKLKGVLSFRELLTGLIIGLIVGGVAPIAAVLWLGNPDIGIVVFISMVATCIIASVVGYLILWITHKLGWDPAAASDPVITTIKDITALLIYFTIAALLVAELQI